MTYAEVLTEARRLSRVTASGLSDANALPVVSMAIRRFVTDIGGLRFTRKLQATGYFIPETFEGFNLAITGSTNNDIDSDIAVTDTGGTRLTGTEMATELQAQIRTAIGGGADLTVAWSNFKFVVDAIDSTTVEIDNPTATVTYIDSVAKYFGNTATGTTSITGGFPMSCTVAAPLVGNFRKINALTWDRVLLREGTESLFINPNTRGTPAYYFIDNWKYILLFPVPTSQKDLTVVYEGLPTILASPLTSTELPTEIPVEYQKAISNKVAEEMLLGTHEPALANRMRAEYDQYVREYKIYRHNQNTNAHSGRRVEYLNWYVE